jgi:SAM-dependent methyltransferase
VTATPHRKEVIAMAVEQIEVDPAKVDELMGRLIQDFAGAGSVPLTLIGIRTGLWTALAGAGPLTPAEVAERSGTAEPYVAEWLKAQAAGGYLDHHPDGGRFSLPPEGAAVLADERGTMLVGGFAQMLLAMSRDWVLVEEGFRSGRGVGWHEHSPEHWEGADLATASFIGADLPAWLLALDGVDERLRAGARVADVGCGFGAPTIVMAGQYPAARLWGFDYHDASVARARKAAAAAGVADRVRFEVATAKTFPGDGYDLVVYVDSLHDLGDPVGALAHTRRALAPDGTVLLIEPNGADRVETTSTRWAGSGTRPRRWCARPTPSPRRARRSAPWPGRPGCGRSPGRPASPGSAVCR